MSTESPRLTGIVPAHLRVRQSKILIDSLEVMTDIGFHEFEIGKLQRLLISIEIWLEDCDVPHGDDPIHAWNYDFLKNEVIRIAQERRYNLQESLAHAIFERVAAYRGVKGIRVKTVKPDIYSDAKGVGVEIVSFSGESP